MCWHACCYKTMPPNMRAPRRFLKPSRYSQDIEAQQIAGGITALLNLPNFKPDSTQALRRALDHYLQGMDFADALHLALSTGHSKFMSFDKSFARQANKNGLLPELVLI
jgi:predicted nucleic-acid-binding protein